MLHVKPSVPVQDVGRTRQRRSAQARNRLSERIAERRLLAPGARHTALLRRGDSGQHAAAGRLLLAALAERFDSHALLALAVLHWRRGELQSARAAYAAAAHLEELPLVRGCRLCISNIGSSIITSFSQGRLRRDCGTLCRVLAHVAHLV